MFGFSFFSVKTILMLQVFNVLDENNYNILWEHVENFGMNPMNIFKLYIFKTL